MNDGQKKMSLLHDAMMDILRLLANAGSANFEAPSGEECMKLLPDFGVLHLRHT